VRILPARLLKVVAQNYTQTVIDLLTIARAPAPVKAAEVLLSS
jgi:hypothetical protein